MARMSETADAVLQRRYWEAMEAARAIQEERERLEVRRAFLLDELRWELLNAASVLVEARAVREDGQSD
jgi:hypothetical protein